MLARGPSNSVKGRTVKLKGLLCRLSMVLSGSCAFSNLVLVVFKEYID
jgi:hypothetical protein